MRRSVRMIRSIAQSTTAAKRLVVAHELRAIDRHAAGTHASSASSSHKPDPPRLCTRKVVKSPLGVTRIVRLSPQSTKKLRLDRRPSAKTSKAGAGTFDAGLVSPQTPQKEAIMSADEAQKKLKRDLEATRNDLRRAADEIRVKMHLAGMDAKEAWNDIQPRLADFEQRFDAKADEVTEELKALGSDIKKRLLNIKAKLK